MKKLLVVLVLAFTVPALLAQDAQPSAQDEKVIKDPAEHNSYMTAIQAQDQNQKVAALEGFLQQYPNSIVREDALESLMGAYQQTGNAAKTVDTARRLLQSFPNNLSALAVMAFTSKQAAEGGQNPAQNAMEARRYSERGLQAVQTAKKPAAVSDEDWSKRNAQLAHIFHGAIGFAALQTKEYDVARRHLAESVKADANNLGEVYRLALAHLEVPPDQVTPEVMSHGLWHIARAINLAAANPAAQTQIAAYGQKKYTTYHGTEDGWNELLAQAQGSAFPSQGFTVKPDTPADRAARLVKQTPVKDMSPDEWEFVLSNAEPVLAEQVWAQIRGLGAVAFQGKLIEATPRKLTLAATVDAIQENRGNFEVTMAANVPANLMPKEGNDVAVQGKPVSYEASPFMLRMEEGVLIAQPKPTPAPRRR